MSLLSSPPQTPKQPLMSLQAPAPNSVPADTAPVLAASDNASVSSAVSKEEATKIRVSSKAKIKDSLKGLIGPNGLVAAAAAAHDAMKDQVVYYFDLLGVNWAFVFELVLEIVGPA